MVIYIFKLWPVFILYFIKEVESKEERENLFSFSRNTGEEIQAKKEMVRAREKSLCEDVKKAGWCPHQSFIWQGIL